MRKQESYSKQQSYVIKREIDKERKPPDKIRSRKDDTLCGRRFLGGHDHNGLTQALPLGYTGVHGLLGGIGSAVFFALLLIDGV